MVDPLLAITAVLAFGVAALSLGLLRQLMPKVRGTPMWVGILILFMSSAAANSVVGFVAVVAEAGDLEAAASLSRGISVCTLLGEAALVHVMLGAPRRAPVAWAYPLATILYLTAFGGAILAPSGFLFSINEAQGGFPVARRAPAF